MVVFHPIKHPTFLLNPRRNNKHHPRKKKDEHGGREILKRKNAEMKNGENLLWNSKKWREFISFDGGAFIVDI